MILSKQRRWILLAPLTLELCSLLRKKLCRHVVGRTHLHIFSGEHTVLVDNRCGDGEGTVHGHIAEPRKAFLSLQGQGSFAWTGNSVIEQLYLGLPEEDNCPQAVSR